MTEVRTYGSDAIQAIRTASQAHYHLSAMAERKASTLMGASFLVLTLCISQANNSGGLSLAMLLLSATAFLSGGCAAIAGLPTILGGKDYQGQRNLMFFGGFADMKEEEYVAEMMERLADQPRCIEMVARDVYQNGQVLAHKKYPLLKVAYSIFILGLFASVAAFVVAGMS
jgi:hypothetical protein